MAIGFNVVLTVVAVLAVLVMLNYLSGRHFKRIPISTRSEIHLSPRTTSLVQSLTNKIQITLYYDKRDPIYPFASSLAKEFWSLNPSQIHIQTIDYTREPGAADRAFLSRRCAELSTI